MIIYCDQFGFSPEIQVRLIIAIKVINYINELKGKSHRAISTVAQIDFDKSPRVNMTKVLECVDIGGTFLDKMQSVHEKSIDNIIWHREKLEAITIKSGARDEFLLFPVHFSTVLGILVGAIKQEKEIKGAQAGKEVSTTLFADEIILYMRHPKNSTRNLLETVNHLSNVQDTKSMCTYW